MTRLITYSSYYNQNSIEAIGKIIDFKIDGDKFSFVLKAKEKLQCSYYFSNLKEKEEFQNIIKLGIKIKIKGSFSKPQKNTIPHTFNYKNYLDSKKIFWLVNANKIEIINKKESLLYRIKNATISRVNSFSKTKNYMYAFILGDNGNIDYDVYENFQNNGVTHLFAVSGMHVELFIVVINFLLKKLKLKDNLISYFTILFFIFYLFLVGFTASVVRATMFYILLFLNKRFNWNFKTMRLFYLLFLSLLLINPFYIKDIGFIYSFLTSLGLMIFSKKITGNYFRKLLITSSIAFLFSLPVTIYFYYEFNLLTIINNLVVVPIVSLFLFPFSLLTFLLPFLEIFLYYGFKFLEIINAFLNILSINIVVGKISLIFILIYYFGVYLIYRYKTTYVLFLFLIILSFKYKFCLDWNNYVYFLDVGQGDATLIVTKNQKDIILIDSGGKIEYEKDDWQIRNTNFNLSDNIIKFMKSIGISKIDFFIGTHGDYDHMGEAINIVENFRVKKVIFNCGTFNNLENELTKVLDKKKIEYYTCIKELNISNNKLYFLNPKQYDNENDNSSVIYVDFSGIKFLFMGDASILTEKEILNKYQLLKIDVLKVGHHGSKTSSSEEFINTINPKYSIISVGKNNRYGHPNKEAIENLEKSKIYRTDIDGSIMFKIKKEKLDIEICPP